jgi:hypothetical protein
MYKKILSFIIVSLMVITNFKMVFAESDVTPPAIIDMSWSATELKVGENLDILIDASDTESGIATGQYDNVIYIKNKISNQSKYAYLSYDEATKKIKATFAITPDMPSGEWILSLISLKDKAGNQKYYFQSNLTKEYIVNIITDTKDVTPPAIIDMAWSATELKAGENLDILIDASDTESGIATGQYDNVIYIKNKISNQSKYAYLGYDEATKKMKATLAITPNMPSGEWILSLISLKDKAGNQKYYFQSNLTKEYIVNVITDTKDVTPPAIIDMAWSATELKAGENLDILIDASDTESGIATGQYDNVIYIKNKISNQSKYAYLGYDEATKKMKATLAITPDMPSGEWILSLISLKDKAGNQKYYFQSNLTKEYIVNVKSVYTGTENISVIKNRVFNPLYGVKAESNLEGDFTDKITCTGSVDTSCQGIYLIKYEAVGKNGDVYKDYRWITAVNEQADDSQGIYFNNDVKINTSSLIDLSSVSITKDGSSYNLNNAIELYEEGKYSISFNNTTANVFTLVKSTTNLFSNSALITEANSSQIQPSSLEFTIDKTAPIISVVLPQTVDEGNQVTADKFILAKDNCGAVKYSFSHQPDWLKIGTQDVEITIKDLAGNMAIQKTSLTTYDKCDLDRNENVNIIDLANAAQNYNINSSTSPWNSRSDFNNDNVMDIFDLVILSKRMK